MKRDPKEATNDDLRAAKDLLQSLVQIPSVNPRETGEGAEEPVARFIADWLADHGLEAQIDEVLPGRPNVVAHLRARNRSNKGALLLESHTDTVSIDGMTVPAFEGEVRDGRLYGRGACDAKGSLAAYMLALGRLASKQTRPTNPVQFAAVIGEEYLGLGTKHLVETGLRAIGAIVGEPTDLRLVVASKGVLRFNIRAIGKSAHSSRPWEGENAIDMMADVIIELREIERALGAGVVHPYVGPATHSLTLIDGGSGTNLVPHECTLHVNRRLLPGENAIDVWEGYRRQLESLGPHRIEVEAPAAVANPMDTNVESPIVRAMAEALSEFDLDSAPVGVTFASDGSTLAAAGIPTLVFGPGSISDAHQPDESVSLQQVALAAMIVERFVEICVT